MSFGDGNMRDKVARLERELADAREESELYARLYAEASRERDALRESMEAGHVPLPIGADLKVWRLDDCEFVDFEGVRRPLDKMLFDSMWGWTLESCGQRYEPHRSSHVERDPLLELCRRRVGEYMRALDCPEPVVGFGNEVVGEKDPNAVLEEMVAEIRELLS